MSTTPTRREHDVHREDRRQERRVLVVAVALSLTMFGWQGYHLYWARQAASHQQTTTLVEAIRSSGERQIDLVESLEHDVLVAGHRFTGAELTDWASHYASASAQTQSAVDAGLAEVGDDLEDAIVRVDTARSDLDHLVENVLEHVSAGRGAGRGADAAAALLDPEYLTAQVEFERAVDGQMAGLAAELDATTAAERLNELHSVVTALVLFTAAIGAWAIFLRRLRRSRLRLADEEEKRLEAEAELSQLQKMEALGMMANGVAHDVKNLTVIISGSADEVRKGLPDGHPASVALTRIEEATRQADDVAKSLLAFSRKPGANRAAVDLASLTVGMTQLLRYMVPAPIELVVEVPPAAWVCGDATQLQQVIFNLAANAREAMPDGGTLTIAIRPAPADDATEPRWLLVISDTGEGMTADVASRMFEPFFTSRPTGRGSGLGLAIVKRIVSEHRGRIEVSTRLGEGSTFTIDLPALLDPSPDVDEPEPRGALVLVANPSSYVRDLIGGALSADGHRTLTASTEDEILAGLRTDSPMADLAVVDARLFPAGLLRLRSHVPIILTGPEAATVELDGLTDVYVVGDPLVLSALTQRVASILRSESSLVMS